MQRKLSAVVIAMTATIAMVGPTSVSADRTLGAAEIKALITDKTVHVTRKKDGAQWKIFFAADGKGYESAGEAKGTWEVKDNGEHCTSWAPLKCAKIANLGDGNYARLSPNGDVAVTWTKIEDGKQL
jgi:hypothetical protein